MERTLENKVRATNVFDFIYGDEHFRKENAVTVEAQKHIQNLLRDTLHVAGKLEILAGDPCGLQDRELEALQAEIASLNRRFGLYQSTVEIAFKSKVEDVMFRDVWVPSKTRTLLEHVAARNIFALAEGAAILNIRRCEGCPRFMFSWRLADSWCSPNCRQNGWNKSSGYKAVRAARAKANYHRVQAEDARLRGEKSRADLHRNKENAARTLAKKLDRTRKVAPGSNAQPDSWEIEADEMHRRAARNLDLLQNEIQQESS